MIKAMAVRKITISLDEALAEAMATQVEQAGDTTSGWVADALRSRLRREALLAYLKEYEAEHGELTAEELEEADAAWPA